MQERERWATRIGLVLAMSGNAIGLGNLLRFPVQAAQNGGGAFMIPYVISLVLLAMPLMWVEWAMGRYGGVRGHGTTPGIFHLLWKHPAAKYLGVLGIFLPLGVTIYYVYVESWCLGYSVFSATGRYFGDTGFEGMKGFLEGYKGNESVKGFSGVGTAYIFFLITIGLNVAIMYRGIARGIELLAKIAMPTLLVFAIILVIRTFMIGTPVDTIPERNVFAGLAFIWNPDFTQLKNAKVWLAATGQVFFTLSIGFGAIQCYASYLREKDDVALTGLSTAASNEFVEIVLGGSIAIPIAFAFFGYAGTLAVAQGFDLGFVAMPIIFQKIPVGELFGTLWFLLLFFAGITSSVALSQPAITFLQDELKMTREKAVLMIWGLVFICAQPVIFFEKGGFLNEMDFWAGTLGLPVMAFLEVILFVWIFGSDNAWNEITRGADIKVPRIVYPIMKYLTPVFLVILFGVWVYQDLTNVKSGAILMKGAEAPGVKWGARLMMAGIIGLFVFLIKYASNKWSDDEPEEVTE